MFNSFFLRIVFILVTIAGLAILFYLPYSTVKNKTIDSHNREQIFLARQAAQGVENTFAMYGKALKHFADQPEVADLDTQGRQMLQNFYAIHKPTLISVIRFNNRGEILHRISDSHTINEELLQPSFIVAQSQKSGVVDIITSQLTLAAFFRPVFHEGEPDGSLMFLISFQDLTRKFLAPLESAQSKRLWIINQKGIVLECPNPAHFGAHISDTTREVDSNSTLLSFMQEMVLGGRGEGSFEIMDNGSNFDDPVMNHVVFMPIRLPGDNHWSIAYATPEKIVLSNMLTFRNYWLLVSCIALFILLLFSYFLIRSMTVVEEEKKRRKLETQLLQLMDFTPIGIIVYDVHGELKYANKTASEMWRSNTSSDLRGINVFDYIHPDHLEKSKERFKSVMRGATIEPSVVKLVFLNDTEKYVEINSAPFYFSGQRCGVTVLQDVTQRLKDEEEQRRLATAIAHTNDSIVITDQRGTIQYVNPAFSRITGYSRSEAIGRNPRMLKSGHQNEAFYRQMWETLNRGQVWQGKLINRKKDGSTYTELASISPILDSSNKITHFVAVKRDISHEEQLESQLRQAQKMEAIGTLAGGIAHDFNNILGAIIGFTDISLLQTPADSPVQENLRRIKSSGQRAADLIQQILTFSRQASQRDRIHVSVVPLLKETIKLLRASIPSIINIELDINEQEAWIEADPVQVQQVVMNLCTNAFHAMKEEGGNLTVTLSKLPLGKCSGTEPLAQSSCIEIQIADTGPGIDKAIIDRIFDPFFTTKEPGVGTGMGLSVVHGIIQELEGMITVDSSADKGTCFKVLLPAADKPSHEEESLYSRIEKGTESILIVDDEQEIRDTSSMMMEQLGYTVTVSENPLKALDIIKDPENHFDLVISDQTMPEMTGLDMLQHIRRIKPDLPVIICTGYSEELNEETARAMGARMYIMKPINFKQLAGMVRQVIDSEKPDQEEVS